MKNGYKIHNLSTAPAAAQPFMQSAAEHYGFLPNAIGAMAESPETLSGYLALDDLVSRTGLNDTERHVALLAITRELECPYCVAAHSAFAKIAALPEDMVSRLRSGDALDEPRLAALEAFTSALVRKRARVSDEEISVFLQSGYTRRNVLELILLVASKTIAVYSNRIMGTDLDHVLAPERWELPIEADRQMLQSTTRAGGIE